MAWGNRFILIFVAALALVAPAWAETNPPAGGAKAQTITDINATFARALKPITAALDQKCVTQADQDKLVAQANAAVDAIERWAFDHRASAEGQEASDRAGALRGQIAQLRAKPVCPPGAGQPAQPPGPAGQGGGKAGAPALPKYPCLTPEAEQEIALRRAELALIQSDVNVVVQERSDLREKQSEIAKRIAHLTRVIEGKEELTDQEKDENLPAAAQKIDAQQEAKDVAQELVEVNKKLEALIATAGPIGKRIDELEKLKPCPEIGDGGGKPPVEKPPGGVEGGGAKAGGGAADCVDDETLIKEWERQIALLEKGIADIGEQVGKIDSEIRELEADNKILPELRQERIARLNERKKALEERRSHDQASIELLKGRIKAAREKKPCPPPSIGKPLGMNFQGPYIGAQGSFAVGHSRWREPETSTDRFGLSGMQGGFAAGFDQPVGQAVLGVIADIAWGTIDGRTFDHCGPGCRTSITWLATLRARIGLPFDPGANIGTLMPYLTGGLAIGHVRADVAGFPGNGSTELGWVAGFGVDATLATRPMPGIERIGMRLEALWFDLGSPQLCAPAQCGGTAKVKASGTLLRAAIDVHF